MTGTIASPVFFFCVCDNLKVPVTVYLKKNVFSLSLKVKDRRFFLSTHETNIIEI